ncbi:MAG: MAPEG family protein [Pseudomonadota bacterium]
MSHYEIFALYAGLFVLLFVALKLNSGRVRVGEKVNFGDGGNEEMQKAMRVQANAVEDVPIVLIGLLALTLLSVPTLLLHLVGGGFLLGRVLHALGLGSQTGTGWPRLVGTLLTLIMMLVTAGACLWFAFG